jgi:hypothetical protein
VEERKIPAPKENRTPIPRLPSPQAIHYSDLLQVTALSLYSLSYLITTLAELHRLPFVYSDAKSELQTFVGFVVSQTHLKIHLPPQSKDAVSITNINQ